MHKPDPVILAKQGKKKFKDCFGTSFEVMFVGVGLVRVEMKTLSAPWKFVVTFTEFNILFR